jgi:hypothetical protein
MVDPCVILQPLEESLCNKHTNISKIPCVILQPLEESLSMKKIQSIINDKVLNHI